MTDDVLLRGETDQATVNGHEDTNAETVSLDSLHTQEINHAEVDDTLRRGLSPAGTYLTNPAEFGEMNATVAKVEEKDDAGKVIGERLVITLVGRGTARVRLGTENKEVTAPIRVQMSPDTRRKRDFQTGEELEQNDSKSQRWAEAVKAYEQQFKERPKNVGAVVEFLQKYPARFRVIQVGVPTKNNPTPDGEPRNFVMAIYAARAGR